MMSLLTKVVAVHTCFARKGVLEIRSLLLEVALMMSLLVKAAGIYTLSMFGRSI